MPLIPAFQLKLNNAILPNLAAVGKYDAKHPSLTCATSAGKIFVHSPHLQNAEEGEVRFLNINQQISALTAGNIGPLPTRDFAASSMDPRLGRDVLFVGTQTNLLVYDVEYNSDVFYKEVDDGVNVLCLGKLGDLPDPLAIVGGSGNIQGFDVAGNERFWTVTGDSVGAMMLYDVNSDGRSELVVGSDDYDIRIFRQEEVISEFPESDVICGLSPLYASRFAYALGNGTVGVYEKGKRIWRAKSKNTPVCLTCFDLDLDGVPEIVTGWQNGKLEVRSDKGDVIFKDHFSSPISAAVTADYRMDGKEELIVCSLDGEVKGYLPQARGAQATLLEKNVVEETLVVLNAKKQQLQFDLKNIEDMAQMAGGSSSSSASGVQDIEGSGMPEFGGAAKLSSRIASLPESEGITIEYTVKSDYVIRGAMVLGDQCFPSGSCFFTSSDPSSSLTITLSPPKNMSDEVTTKLFVGPKGGGQYIVLESTHKLPKFAMFAPLTPNKVKDPSSRVTFQITERVPKVVAWAKQSFLVEQWGSDSYLDLCFMALRDKKPLRITMSEDVVNIRTDDAELAGDIIQDLCEFLKIQELDSVANFPAEVEAFKQIVGNVADYNASRLKLTAEMADCSNLVKTLLIKAEDCRLLGDMRTMKQVYSTLYEVNKELIGEYKKRENNQVALMNALRDMNQAIQRAAKLRVGTAKTRIVNSSREAVLSNNVVGLLKIIKLGKIT